MKSVYIDANIFVRHIIRDQEILALKAKKVFDEIAEGLILGICTTLTLHEVIHVLEHVYKQERKKISEAVLKLLKLENLFVEDMKKPELSGAISTYSSTTIDFPDCILAARAKSSNNYVATLDSHFAKLEVKSYLT